MDPRPARYKGQMPPLHDLAEQTEAAERNPGRHRSTRGKRKEPATNRLLLCLPTSLLRPTLDASPHGETRCYQGQARQRQKSTR